MIDENCPSDRHHEHVQTTITLVSTERADNHEEEEKEKQVEQFEPPQNSNPSNDKEMSIEAHSFVTIPLETYHSPQVSSFQCLKEPSYVEIFLKNFYIRWWNILPEGYHILKKKEWKGLIGYDMGMSNNNDLTLAQASFQLSPQAQQNAKAKMLKSGSSIVCSSRTP
jgi:hypothetical protein